MKRSEFLKLMGAAATSGSLLPKFATAATGSSTAAAPKPVSIATWNFGVETTQLAHRQMLNNTSAIDATEAGVRLCEADPNEHSVGLGGLPDRDGRVTLDACCMDHLGNIGSVAAVENIVHVSSLARAVMEQTPHVMIVGEGAKEFARELGFPMQDLTVPESMRQWEEWKKTSEYKPIINVENHDTIGQLSLDKQGHLAGICTTSGLAYKMRGRVGDSPIIGAGLYVDGDVGAATATGHGEEVIRVVGSYRVVSEMERGYSPQEACERAVRKIYDFFQRRDAGIQDTQIGFIAIDKNGGYGGYSLRPGFQYAVTGGSEEKTTSLLIDAPSMLDS